MQVSAADRPPGPSRRSRRRRSSRRGRRAPALQTAVWSMCSTTARPRFAAFLTSGLPATSPIRYWPGTTVWKFSSISGTFSGGGTPPSGNMTSASVGHANMHASHWMQSWNRSTRLLFADQVEDVGRAHRHARIAARAAVVVDVVDQDPRGPTACVAGGAIIGVVPLAGRSPSVNTAISEDGEAP